MADRDLPLSVFHFDCFWMREFHWCDFDWDDRDLPRPGRHAAPGSRSAACGSASGSTPTSPSARRCSPRAREHGYLLRRPDGDVWQSDQWQAGMGIVDFTNPDARAWYADKLRALLDLGVDCFKTDFGERIPTDVVWSDGSDPERMHNYYTYLYNKTRLRPAAQKSAARARPCCSPARPPPAASSSRSTGAATASRRSTRWPRACAAACRWPRPASASGATTSAASRDARTRRCSSGGSRSACCPPTAGCTAATATACRGCSTRSRSRCSAGSPS